MQLSPLKTHGKGNVYEDQFSIRDFFSLLSQVSNHHPKFFSFFFNYMRLIFRLQLILYDITTVIYNQIITEISLH